MNQRLGLAVVTCSVLGCGGGGAGGDGLPGGDAGADALVIPDAGPPPEGFTRLIGRTWSLRSGALDTYRCVRVTIPEDMYITNIIAQAPFGTHHTVLSIADGSPVEGPDGEQNCGVGSLGMQMLYASAVGTDPLDFPAGVGIKVSAGQQLHLNLHLFNATDNAIAGDSAILVKSQPTPPPILAEMVFAGTFLVAIPSNNMLTPISGGCTSDRDFTLFAVWPHMHQLARSQKVEITRGGATTTIHNEPFTFSEQKYYLQNPEVEIRSGDQIKVTCTYLNNTGQTVFFGDSSLQEMCFAGMYRYPAANAGLFQCANGGF